MCLSWPSPSSLQFSWILSALQLWMMSFLLSDVLCDFVRNSFSSVLSLPFLFSWFYFNFSNPIFFFLYNWLILISHCCIFFSFGCTAKHATQWYPTTYINEYPVYPFTSPETVGVSVASSLCFRWNVIKSYCHCSLRWLWYF